MMKNYQKVILMALALPIAACQKSQLSGVEGSSGLSHSSDLTKSYSGTTTTYYVDNSGGSDSSNGLTTSTAWRTLNKVNSFAFLAGNRIRFKCGGNWSGQLQIQGSGTSGSPIRIDSYNSGPRPVINGGGVANGTIYLYNQDYIEISDLEITNFNASEEGGSSISAWENSNTTNYANVTLPPAVSNTRSRKFGVYVLAHDKGVMSHIYLHNLNIHGVNGLIDDSDGSKNNGGIDFKINGTTTRTHFHDLLVDSCTIHDVDRTGMFFESTWDDRTASNDNTWTPATNVVIRANTFRNTGANALIVRVATAPLMEHNLFDHCAIKETGNAGFNFNTDDAVWQYNEGRFTRANVGDHDAGGLDADFRTKRTILQYNYLHDNDFGLLVTGGDHVFNQSTIIRYNLIVKDGTQSHPHAGKFFMQINGECTDLHIYNNTIDIGPSQSGTNIFSFTPWAGTTSWPDQTNFYNNIIDNSGSASNYSFGSSTNNTFDYNCFYVNAASNQPTQVHNITGNVNFYNTGLGTPSGFKLQSGSVAINAGKVISTNGGLDYFGNTVSLNASSNIGFYNGPAL